MGTWHYPVVIRLPTDVLNMNTTNNQDMINGGCQTQNNNNHHHSYDYHVRDGSGWGGGRGVMVGVK